MPDPDRPSSQWPSLHGAPFSRYTMLVMHPHHGSLDSWCTRDPLYSQFMLVCSQFILSRCNIIVIHLLHNAHMVEIHIYCDTPPSWCSSLAIHLGLLGIHFLHDQPKVLYELLKMNIWILKRLRGDALVQSAPQAPLHPNPCLHPYPCLCPCPSPYSCMYTCAQGAMHLATLQQAKRESWLSHT